MYSGLFSLHYYNPSLLGGIDYHLYGARLSREQGVVQGHEKSSLDGVEGPKVPPTHDLLGPGAQTDTTYITLDNVGKYWTILENYFKYCTLLDNIRYY